VIVADASGHPRAQATSEADTMEITTPIGQGPDAASVAEVGAALGGRAVEKPLSRVAFLGV
jgi:hypothetical protein